MCSAVSPTHPPPTASFATWSNASSPTASLGCQRLADPRHQRQRTEHASAREVPLIEGIRDLVMRRISIAGNEPDARLFTGPRGVGLLPPHCVTPPPGTK